MESKKRKNKTCSRRLSDTSVGISDGVSSSVERALFRRIADQRVLRAAPGSAHPPVWLGPSAPREARGLRDSNSSPLPYVTIVTLNKPVREATTMQLKSQQMLKIDYISAYYGLFSA